MQECLPKEVRLVNSQMYAMLCSQFNLGVLKNLLVEIEKLPSENEPPYDLYIQNIQSYMKNINLKVDWVMDWSVPTLKWQTSMEKQESLFKGFIRKYHKRNKSKRTPKSLALNITSSTTTISGLRAGEISPQINFRINDFRKKERNGNHLETSQLQLLRHKPFVVSKDQSIVHNFKSDLKKSLTQENKTHDLKIRCQKKKTSEALPCITGVTHLQLKPFLIQQQ